MSECSFGRGRRLSSPCVKRRLARRVERRVKGSFLKEASPKTPSRTLGEIWMAWIDRKTARRSLKGQAPPIFSPAPPSLTKTLLIRKKCLSLGERWHAERGERARRSGQQIRIEKQDRIGGTACALGAVLCLSVNFTKRILTKKRKNIRLFSFLAVFFVV